jgi:hypothetical protein
MYDIKLLVFSGKQKKRGKINYIGAYTTKNYYRFLKGWGGT